MESCNQKWAWIVSRTFSKMFDFWDSSFFFSIFFKDRSILNSKIIRNWTKNRVGQKNENYSRNDTDILTLQWGSGGSWHLCPLAFGFFACLGLGLFPPLPLMASGRVTGGQRGTPHQMFRSNSLPTESVGKEWCWTFGLPWENEIQRGR